MTEEEKLKHKDREAKLAAGNYFQEKLEKVLREEQESKEKRLKAIREDEDPHTDYESQVEEQSQVSKTDIHNDRETDPNYWRDQWFKAKREEGERQARIQEEREARIHNGSRSQAQPKVQR